MSSSRFSGPLKRVNVSPPNNSMRIFVEKFCINDVIMVNESLSMGKTENNKIWTVHKEKEDPIRPK